MSKKTIEDIYPLTPLQEGLLYHAVLAPKDGAYHDQFSAMLRGPLEADRLVQAWRTVAAGHAIFRTAFAWKTGKWWDGPPKRRSEWRIGGMRMKRRAGSVGWR